ncbi:helix-turn-helix domain-containing protein [Bernardetia sp.]|uniref:helix-turn-helix domain-containing protein n=1 Tax=Bernardetia sp. TaxID=1937974 RepID=UPI0025BECB56|nr:helix-turn-helix transcriptional regulator [Bernardetia sp.]
MIGKKIKKVIEESSFSQAEVAEKLKISIPTLRRIYGRDSVETNVLIGLCKLFNLQPSFFMSELENLSVSEETEIKNDSELLKENYSFVKQLSDTRKELADTRKELNDLYKNIVMNNLKIDLGNSLGKAKAYLIGSFENEEVTETKFVSLYPKLGAPVLVSSN